MFSEKVDLGNKKNYESMGEFTKVITEACNSLEKDLNRTKGEIDTLKAQNEELKAKYERLSKAYNDVVEKKNKALEIAKQVDALKDQVDRLEEDLRVSDIVIGRQEDIIKRLKAHINNADIHKKPLNDDARQRSIEVRREHSADKAKENMIKACMAVENYWNKQIGNQGDSNLCYRADMSKVMAFCRMSETTIREALKDKNAVKEWAKKNNKRHLYKWAEKGGKFTNAPREQTHTAPPDERLANAW